MISYQPGDLVLASFPYSLGGQAKRRPALVLLDTGDADVLVARITTQMQRALFDVPLVHWQKAGLLAPSIVRLHKQATLEKTLVSSPIGHLEPADRQQVAGLLRQLYLSW